MEKVIIKGVGEFSVDLPDVLYHGACGECENELDWRFDSDPDCPSYFSECCDFYYFMKVETVRAYRTKKN